MNEQDLDPRPRAERGPEGNYDPADVAETSELRDCTVPPASNTDAWLALSAPVLELIREQPQTQAEIRSFTRSQRKGRKLLLHAFDWLSIRGLIRKVDGRWMVAEQAALVAPAAPAPAPPEPDPDPDEDEEPDDLNEGEPEDEPEDEPEEEKTVADRPTDLKTAAEIAAIVKRSKTWPWVARLNRFPGPNGEALFSESEALRAVERHVVNKAKAKATLAKVEERLERKAAAAKAAPPKAAPKAAPKTPPAPKAQKSVGWISSEEASRRIGVHPVRVRELARQGKLERKDGPSRPQGGFGGYLYRADQVDELAAARSSSGQTAARASKARKKQRPAPAPTPPAPEPAAAPEQPSAQPATPAGYTPFSDFIDGLSRLCAYGLLPRAKLERILAVLVES